MEGAENLGETIGGGNRTHTLSQKPLFSLPFLINIPHLPPSAYRTHVEQSTQQRQNHKYRG
ncbi:hypothetical protein JMJ77_0005235 [Colletotrichum scovillei]|uniref:Uncharacterized protein n=1 Tax=Colletotrichum scovillei TaxID=1209932 RepID=A0A9P7RIL6_9PEZI|nr:hypothetical protein JMJ77_0005235 [Colletotrichum scovillei]KAG7076449.1 hypothetical protein JMJ76_0013714 [Colletotrichum scovillei]KAG7083532.1 hypothetical protein JMJ78_0008977 [Colletotrichum scovillei]